MTAENLAMVAKDELAALAAKHSYEARTLMYSALHPAVEYILAIGANNPVEKTLNRKDVKAGLSAAEDLARRRVKNSVDTAWIKGGGLGRKLARSQMKALGLKVATDDMDTAALKSLKADVDAILSAIPTELAQAYRDGGKNGLEAAQRRLAYRLSLAVDAAVAMGHASGLEALSDASGTVKMWKARSAVPCSHCARLDGMERPWGKPFPEHFPGLKPLKVYGEKLMGPPRHPNCRCTLVLKKA